MMKARKLVSRIRRKESLQPCKYALEVVAGSGEDGVGSIAGAAFVPLHRSSAT
jgi:hypothetical protein